MIWNARMCGLAGALALCAAVGVGCETTVEVDGEAKPRAAGERVGEVETVAAEPVVGVDAALGAELSAGYGLLHGVVGKQRQVGMLFALKRPRAEVREAVEAVGAASGEMYRWLEGRRAELSAAGVEIGDGGLPAVEAAARGAIEGETRGAILIGGAWERTLVLSQVSSTEYLSALGGALAEREVSGERAERLRGFADEMAELHAQVLRLLAVVDGGGDG
ncbi:MAG: hypothetical protein AAF078_09775 [Planctomycetota bacterium]